MCSCRIAKVAKHLLNENATLKAQITTLENKVRDLEGENKSYSEIIRNDFAKLKTSVESLAKNIDEFLESEPTTEMLEKLAKQLDENDGLKSERLTN